MKRCLLLFLLSVVLCPLCAFGTFARAAEPLQTLTVSIFACRAALSSTQDATLGHAFVTVENNASRAVVVGAVTLKAGETCSIGSWSMTGHRGVWYNLEAAYIAANLRYGGRVSISLTVDLGALDALNEYIAAHDAWTPIRNCAQFAVGFFRAAGGQTLDLRGIVTPSRLADAISANPAHQTDRPVPLCGKAGYRRADGTFCAYTLRAA